MVLVRLLRFLTGLAAGTLLWLYSMPSYHLLLAAGTQPLLRIDRRFADASLVTRGTSIEVHSDHGSFPPLALPAGELTYNVILLAGLFAASSAPMSRRNLLAAAAAMVAVVLLHFIAALITIESGYAIRAGNWSDEHYGVLAANLWVGTEMFYRLVGMFAVPFVFWWVAGQKEPKTAKKAGRARPDRG